MTDAGIGVRENGSNGRAIVSLGAETPYSGLTMRQSQIAPFGNTKRDLP